MQRSLSVGFTTFPQFVQHPQFLCSLVKHRDRLKEATGKLDWAESNGICDRGHLPKLADFVF
jgi:hypothetical protein